MSASQVWLITGASSGLGTSIAISALKAGHKVIATARNPIRASETNPAVEELGGQWLRLDVTSGNVQQVVEETLKQYGKIDVLVNNAGYSLLGAFEDFNDEEVHSQMNTNFYGPIKVIRGALPFMRSNKAGTIINISSVAGLDGLPSCSMYAASKFALEGLSESLARELAPFNIRVLIVEPGAFRTKFLSSVVTSAAGLSKPYEGTPAHDVLKHFDEMNNNQPGDPVKAGDRIVEVVTNTSTCDGLGNFIRLPLGADCLKRVEEKAHNLRDNVEAARSIAESTDY